MDENPIELFDLFWENSKFSDATIGGFQKRMESYSGSDHDVAAIQYPGSDVPLVMPRDSLQKYLSKRRSSRAFSSKPLSHRALGGLFAAFAESGPGKVFPSAGATFATEFFCLALNTNGPTSGKVCYYNADNHTLSIVRDSEEWDVIRPMINIDTMGTVPAAIFIFVLFPSRVGSKYGERGGRFALLEAGHAAQNLGLRAAAAGLAGVEIGGLMDDKIKAVLGLSNTDARVVLGFACGHPTKSS